MEGSSTIIAMKGNMFILVVFSGMFFLPACFPHLYILVEKAATWAEAQRYCRETYTDLATVSSEEDSSKLALTAQEHYNDSVWIGLYDDINSWRWSLHNEPFYIEGEANFQNWLSGEPDNFMGLEDCVVMHFYGWNDCECNTLHQFVCYNGSGEAATSSNYVLVAEFKNWSEAQQYCRQLYTDLVSVRNLTESKEISNLAQNQVVWNGLHRDSWKWSDGSPTSVHMQIPPYSPQASYINTCCAALHEGQWEAHSCQDNLVFVCNAVPVTQMVVRVEITKNKSTVKLEDAAEAILQQFRQILEGRGLSEHVQLTWRKWPNGNVFHLGKTGDEENWDNEENEPQEKICSFK